MGHSHHHHSTEPGELDGERFKETRKVTLIGAVVDFVLGVTKIVVGIIGNSQALIADGIHSFSDLITDGLVLFAVKHSSRGADAKHPYGHGRIETLTTVILGVALVAVAIGIGYDATLRLMHPELLQHPGWLALSVATLSVAAKEGIYHYTLRTAEKFNSNLLRANAWHSRSDAISSVIVMVGVMGSMGGLVYLDAVAAIGVGIMVAKIGVDLSWHSIQELIDTAMEPEQIEQIRTAIQSVDGVQALHMLRTRRMGSDGMVDVHILVNSKISVSEGHRISDTVRAQIIRDVADVTDVMVHIDPEDDEKVAPSSGLPLRKEVLKILESRWQGLEATKYLEDTVLHYLDGKIHVEVLLPIGERREATETQSVTDELSRLVQDEKCIADVRVRFH